MADGIGQEAPYGQFGHAGYNPEDRSWAFGRIQTSGTYFELLQEPRLFISAPRYNVPAEDATPTSQRLSTRYQRQIEGLVRSHAAFQPSAPLLRPFAYVSETVQAASDRHDPVRGSLMSVGDISSEAYHRPISVVAVATGKCRSDLLIFRVVMRKHVWNDKRLPAIGLPEKRSEEILWAGGHGPIQQVKFRRCLDRNTSLLAVRQLDATTIYRPVQSESLQICPNLLSTITSDQTGGVGHADVALNPWFAQQVALVDRAGQWSALEFDSRKFKRIVRTWKGSAITGSHEHPSSYDGWARISWVASLTLLAVCTRSSLMLIDISDKEPATVQTTDFASNSAADFITDMVVLPLSDRMDLLSVLTSTHLQICRVTRDLSGNTALHRIFSIRHFQNPSDLSLCLDTAYEADYINVTLYSRAHHYVWCHPLHITDRDYVYHCDPIPVKLPKGHFTSQGRSLISDLRFYSVEAAGTSEHPEHLIYLPRHGNRIYILDVLLTSGIMYSCLYRHTRTGTTKLLQVLPISRKLPSSISRVRRPSYAFVVNDDESRSERGQIFRFEPISRRARRPQTSSKPKDRIISFESLAGQLQIERTAPAELSMALSHIKRSLQEPLKMEMPYVHPFYELLKTEATFRDTEEAEANLQETVKFLRDQARRTDASEDRFEQPQRLIIDTISLPSLARQHLPPDPTNLSAIYDTITTAWITSLPDLISVRTRLAKEQLARRIASDVVLAQYSTRIEPTPATKETQAPQDEVDPPPSTWDLPLRTGDLSRQSGLQDRFLAPTNSLPTPSPTATPSIATASNAWSSLGSSEIGRLSQYTAFSKPAPLALPRNLDNILSHWTIGEDPEDYDWLSTALARRDEEAEDSMTDRERRRAHRRAERHILRQRKEAAASQAQQFASSQAFEVVSASQPSLPKVDSRPPIPGMPSSSQTIDPFSVGASQVMPGRFGGRPPPKKQKRRLGF